jgi:hypothetical protein
MKRHCYWHEKSQEQKLKKKFKSNLQIQNKTRLCDSKTKTQEPWTKTRDLRNKSENIYLLF